MSAVVYLHSCVQLFVTPWTIGPPVSSVHGDSPGKNTGVGCYAFLHGIFMTQKWNSHLLWFLHCRRILYHWEKIDLVYMKPTLIMKNHNWWKLKMEKSKQAFIFYWLIIRKTKTFISICLCLFFSINFSLKYNCFPEFCCFLSNFNIIVFLNHSFSSISSYSGK